MASRFITLTTIGRTYNHQNFIGTITSNGTTSQTYIDPNLPSVLYHNRITPPSNSVYCGSIYVVPTGKIAMLTSLVTKGADTDGSVLSVTYHAISTKDYSSMIANPGLSSYSSIYEPNTYDTYLSGDSSSLGSGFRDTNLKIALHSGMSLKLWGVQFDRYTAVSSNYALATIIETDA